MNYYATSNSPGHPAALLQFDSEVDRDDFVSRKPGERSLADEPEDTAGFRVFQIHEVPGRPLHCKARAIVPPMPAPRKTAFLKVDPGSPITASNVAEVDIAENRRPLGAPNSAGRFNIDVPAMKQALEEEGRRDRGLLPSVGSYPGPNENPSAAVVAGRFADTLGDLDEMCFIDRPSAGLLRIVRLLAWTSCPHAVLIEEARAVLKRHGLVTPKEAESP